MGSWNETCALTNLPICAGERVVLHIIASPKGYSQCTHFGNSFNGTTTVSHPMGPALRGTYNDYGGVTDLEGPALAWWGAHLKELRPYLTDRFGQDSEASLAESVEDFLNSVSGVARGQVYLSESKEHRGEHDTPSAKVGLMLCHEGAYDRFMEAGLSAPDWTFTSNESPVQHYVKDLKKHLKALAKAKGVPRNARGREPYEALGLDLEVVMKSLAIFSQEHNDQALVEEVVCLRIFDMLLGIARKYWGPQNGAGSANNDFTLQLALAQFTVDCAAEQASAPSLDQLTVTTSTSGDWIRVRAHDQLLVEGHRIGINELCSLLNKLGYEVIQQECPDDDM